MYTEMMQTISNITFLEGIQLPDVTTGEPYLVVLDDLMSEATKNKMVSNMYTVGSRHKNASIVTVLHNLYNRGQENRTLTLNSTYLVVFKNPRDQQQMM